MEPQFKLFSLVIVILSLVVLRIINILPATRPYGFANTKPLISNDVQGHKIMIFLGSGGHTGEMIRILSQFETSFLSSLQRRYMISSGDDTSVLKLKDFEKNILNNDSINYIRLPRARNVGEKIVVSIKNSIISLMETFKILVILALRHELPDILLINGPGTSATLAYLIMVMKFFRVCHTKIIYIESLARVKKLSISGKLLRPISDRFIVQWEPLLFGRLEYHGILV